MMGFWSTEQIKDFQQTHPLISDFSEARLKHGKYELRLSREVLVTPDGLSDNPILGEGPSLKIPPGQFALLYTEESINIPDDAIGFISVKTSEKFKGLVNISGFHADPGFKGHLKFTVYNGGNRPIFLDYESECFLLWFSSLDRKTTDVYNEPFQKKRITAKDREQMSETCHSPAELHKRIEKLEDSVNLIIAVGVVIIFPLLIAFAVPVFEHLLGESADNISNSKLIIGTSLVTSFIIVVVLAIYHRWIKNR